MSCKPTYKGKRYNSLEEIKEDIRNTQQTTNTPDFKDFVQSNQVKEGVSELFESNPELANAVYSALGYNKTINISIKEEIVDLFKELVRVDNLPFEEVKRKGLLNSQSETIESIAKQIAEKSIINNIKLNKDDYYYIFDNISSDRLISKVEDYKESFREKLIDKLLKEGKIKKVDVTPFRKVDDTIYNADFYKAYTGHNWAGIGTEMQYSTSDNIILGEAHQVIGAYSEYINKNKKLEISEGITPQQKQQAQQLYSQYLDTIFPDSKVKDIVYHETSKYSKEKILEEGFNTPIEEQLESGKDSLIWFSGKKNYYRTKNTVSISAILNSISPKIDSHQNFERVGDASGIRRYNLEAVGADSILTEEYADESLPPARELPKDFVNPIVFAAVIEPEQIHILGSKQDIEGFKDFVGNQNIKFSRIDSDFNTFVKNGFFSDYNITIQEYDSIKETLGYNNSQMVDMVSKFVAINKGESLDKATAYFAFKLLGKDNNKLRSDLRYRISSWKQYKPLFDKYKKEIFEEHKFINDKKKWKNLVRDKIIIDYLAETIVEYYNNPTEFEQINDKKWSKEDFTFIKKLYDFFVKFFKSLGITNEDRNYLLNNTAKNLAHDLLNKEHRIYNYKLEENQVLKYYNKTIESDKFAKDLVEYFQKLKLVLTGSLALRRAGTVYRPKEEDLHDLDFVFSYDEVQKEINREVIKNIVRFQGDDVKYASKAALLYVTDFDWYNKIKEKYPDITVLNGFYGGEHTSFESYTLTTVVNGEFYKEKGKHEKIQKDGSIKLVKHEKGDWIEGTGYVIDFFIRLKPQQEEHENYFKLWKEIMIAKLLMDRNKDLTDYKEFVPYLKSIDNYNFYYPDWVYSVRDETNKSTSNDINFKNIDNFENFENLFEEVIEKYPTFTKEDFDVLNEEQKQALKKCL